MPLAPLPSHTRLATVDAAPDPIMLWPSHMEAGEQGRWHAHMKGQLIYPQKGRYRIYTHHQMWAGSPRRACWIPAGVEHTVWALDALDIHNVYVSEQLPVQLPTHCQLLPVMPLLEMLLAFGSQLAPHDPSSSQLYAHTLALIADIMGIANREALSPLPMSADRRIRPIMNALLQDPADQRGLADWALATFTTARTLARCFRSEVGMSFSQWRQQLRATEAITRIENGHSVQHIAYDMGYNSQSAFTAMFRRVTGYCPSHFKP